MRCRQPTTVKAVAAAFCCTAALVASAPGANGGSTAFPSSASRLAVLSEHPFGPRLLLLEASGREAASVSVPVGIRSEGAMGPDGTTMALVSTVSFDGGADSELVLIGLTGSGEFLTQNTANEGRPSWSPDGRTIAYASDRDGDWDVYLAPIGDADDPLVNLTAGSAADDRNPRWSPDGTRIAFESDRDGDVDVYVAATDGSAVSPVAPGPATERLGDWAPDGSRLVLSSDREGTFDLYVVAATAGAPVRITSWGRNERRVVARRRHGRVLQHPRRGHGGLRGPARRGRRAPPDEQRLGRPRHGLAAAP